MRIKLLIILSIMCSFLSCGQKNSLTKMDAELLEKISFKAELVSELTDLTQTNLKQLPAIDSETGEILPDKYFDGVYSETSEEKSIKIVKQLKTKFRNGGYLIFMFEGADGKKNVAIIKGTDDLDILRYRRTDGINYDLENEDIVNKIAEWKSKYGLIVLGCDRDWLQVEFDKLPPNLGEFSKEVYEFCPDSVDQGVGTIDNLKNSIKEMNGIWLWWD